MQIEWILIIIAACGASMLTFFSGFGLGTILLPVFALFFPVDISIAMTAIVHFLNNLFKTGLIGRKAVKHVVMAFGIPALIFAFAGAYLLNFISHFSTHLDFNLFGIPFTTSLLEIIIGLLLVVFAIIEIAPARQNGISGTGTLILGGALSGFFGGLSGHQGALRSGFLLRLGLGKEAFIATGILVSLFVDVSRLGVYSMNMEFSTIHEQKWLIVAAVLAAFLGAFIGRQLLRKVSLKFVQYFVAVGIVIIGLLMILGVI